MNICFYTANEISPEIGGTERITASVAKGLSSYYGVKCFSLFSNALPEGVDKCGFEASLKISTSERGRKTLVDFLGRNGITIIINQGAFELCRFFKSVANKVGAKLVTVHHFDPGYEEHFLTFHSLLSQIKNAGNAINFARCMVRMVLYPIKKYRYVKRVPFTYRDAYECSDRIVLLSDKFREGFLKYGNIQPTKDIIEVIPNSLSFDEFFDIRNYSKKEKVVLVVSRLDEVAKRISLVLKIWKDLCANGKYSDWELLIVGQGDYENEYKEYVSKQNLRNVFFEGKQKPQKYYERASIFMLTSSHEGWGLTLTEAQQYGCVPLAFNTYQSLTDIIEDKHTGYIIKEGQVEQYAACMEKLMIDDDLRRQMAEECIESSKRFKSDVVCKKWFDLLNKL